MCTTQQVRLLSNMSNEIEELKQLVLKLSKEVTRLSGKLSRTLNVTCDILIQSCR